jgi:2-succinyl-5-enolpyruvyl-6-hydroxy-3-cyclohexene-1-carboxylate synthase
LHDINGLLGATAPMTMIVLDNDGGGIFSYLPPAQLPEFEQLFGTPHGLDLVEIARAHGVVAERIDDVHKLREAIAPDELASAVGVRVLVVPIDRHASVARHQALWTAVGAALGAPR